MSNLNVNPSVPYDEFSHFCQDATEHFYEHGKEQQGLYVESLNDLFKHFRSKISAVKTTYSCLDMEVILYDVKCKKRGGEEDRVVKRMYQQWTKIRSKHVKGICPFRRGICLGCVGSTYFIAVGNIKFFYSSTEYLCQTNVSPLLTPDEHKPQLNVGKVLLTEKANGELTMCTGLFDSQNRPWLVVGSKNVRLAIPFSSKPLEMNHYLEAIVNSKYSTTELQKENASRGLRFSYLREMLNIWALKLAHLPLDSKIWSILTSNTLIGEQVGVHRHIFDDYDKPDIRIFAILDKSGLLQQVGCDVSLIGDQLDGTGFTAVQCEVFELVPNFTIHMQKLTNSFWKHNAVTSKITESKINSKLSLVVSRVESSKDESKKDSVEKLSNGKPAKKKRKNRKNEINTKNMAKPQIQDESDMVDKSNQSKMNHPSSDINAGIPKDAPVNQHRKKGNKTKNSKLQDTTNAKTKSKQGNTIQPSTIIKYKTTKSANRNSNGNNNAHNRTLSHEVATNTTKPTTNIPPPKNNNAVKTSTLVNRLQQRLFEIASGPIELYGEGVVCCTYDTYGDLIDMFKFKCDQYAFDRRLRTLLSNAICRFPKASLGVQRICGKKIIQDDLDLQREINAISRGMQKSFHSTQFKNLDEHFAMDRISLIPYILLFIEQHQHLIKEFSDHFLDIMAKARILRAKHSNTGNQWEDKRSVEWYSDRLKQIRNMKDPMDDVARKFLEDNKMALNRFRPAIRSVRNLVKELAPTIASKCDQFKLIGISAPPGCGKSTIFLHLQLVLESEFKIRSAVFDRDIYCSEASNPKRVSELWYKDIKEFVEKGGIALVGNCLDGSFANEIEEVIGQKMLVIVPREIVLKRVKSSYKKRKKLPSGGTNDPSSPGVCMFNAYCIERLLERETMLVPDVDNIDVDVELILDGTTEYTEELMLKPIQWKLPKAGSSLTMELGALIVFNKFFSTGPSSSMVEQRKNDGSLIEINMLSDTFNVSMPENHNSTSQNVSKPPKKQSMKKISSENLVEHVKFELVNFKRSVERELLSSNAQSRIKLQKQGNKRVAPLQCFEHTSNLPKKVLYVSATPTSSCKETLLSLCDATLKKQDGHITIVYKPSTYEIKSLIQRLNGSCVLSNISIGAKVTAESKSGSKLQFLMIDPLHKQLTELLDNEFLHITLGTSDAKELPPSTSRMVFEALVQEFGEEHVLHNRKAVDLSVRKSNKSKESVNVVVSVEAIERDIVFNGSIELVCA